MTGPSRPPWLRVATRHSGSYSTVRISDAERADVADLLAKHYGDGRLDQPEFDQRVDQAMRAKTYGDLSGLFADLPHPEEHGGPGEGSPAGRASLGPRRRYPHSGSRVLLFALIAVLAVMAGHALAASIAPWLWIGLIVAVVLLVTKRHGHL